MHKSLLAGVVAISVTAFCAADSYRVEVTGGGGTGEVEAGPFDVDRDFWTVGGDIYFQDVDNRQGPLFENAFLQRASSLSVSYIDGEFDNSLFGTLDFDGYNVAGRFIDKDSGWLVGLEASRVDEELARTETDTYSATIGKYLTDTMVLSFTYENADIEIDPVGKGGYDSYTADFEYVRLTDGGLQYRIDAQLGWIDQDNADEASNIGATLTLYPSRNIAVGASASASDSDNSELRAYSAFVEWFFTDSFAVILSYNTAEDDELDVADDTLLGSVRFRF